MELGLAAVAAVVLLVVASLIGGRIGIAAPLLLVVVGIGIGYLPFVPLIEVEPEVILLGVLPPILYAAAVNVPLVDFRRNFRPVIGLSMLLVIISAVIIGFVTHLLIPAIPLPVAIALGAVVSPTDAVAATSIGKRLGMPDRVVSILEGESLVNDATSLVLLKTALAAVSGSFVFWDAAGSFALSVSGAVVIGGVIGVITVWVRSKLSNPVYDTMISFVVPFVAFIPAEEIGASGVLAVVITGLYTGHAALKRFNALARMTERLNWRTVQFALENGVFLLMGLQLHALVEEVREGPSPLGNIALLSFMVVGLLIVCRALFMVPLIIVMRRDARRYEQRSVGLSRRAHQVRHAENTNTRRLRKVELLEQRSQADLAHERDQQLGWRDGFVLSWAGMRGVVTLAAAQSIPVETPHRAELVVIAFAVAVITLLLHGLSLPPIIRMLWPGGANSGDTVVEFASLSRDLVESANEAIDEAIAEEDDVSEGSLTVQVADRVRAGSRAALGPMAYAVSPDESAHPDAETPAEVYLRLARIALEAQRVTLLEERAIGRYSSQTLRIAERALDSHEARLSPPAAH